MWWPSLVAALRELWQFVFGGNVDELRVEQSGRTASGVVRRSEAPVRIELKPQVVYDATHPDTHTIRQTIAQKTAQRGVTGPLTTTEWVTYRFVLGGRQAPWSVLAQVPPGRWHEVLGGRTAVSITVTPKTGGLMEWFLADGSGMLGYVSQVTPKDTIQVAVLGSHTPGVLETRSLSVFEWKELRPVFISFL